MKANNSFRWFASVSLTKLSLVAIGMFLAAASSAWAAVRYVNLNNASPTPPYTNWVTAAVNIQDAVDAAGVGDEIVATNGTYTGGSRVDPRGVTDRVAVTKPLTLRSVNGPTVTLIDGGGLVRCLYLTNNAGIMGFTLTNGFAFNGGINGRDGGGVYCESTNAVLTNCVLTGNSAVSADGGGAYGGTLNNCTLTGNSAYYSGGAAGCTLNNCILTGNSASYVGGGAYNSTLNNCTLTANTAGSGGGADYSTLNNCTLTGNLASDYGGGAAECTLNNCIVYFNSDPNGGNYDSSMLNYCCTTPLPTYGVGNITADPQLVNASHLSALSPCIGAGSATYSTGTDIDGEPWANPPSIGCDEYHAGAVTGPLTVSLTANYTNVTTGFPVALIGSIYAQLGIAPTTRLPNPEGLPTFVMPQPGDHVKSAGVLKEIMSA